MKQKLHDKAIIILLLFSLQLGFSPKTTASTGDTTIVHGFANFLHQNCNTGTSTFLFPSDSLTYYRILLKYSLSCPGVGCDIYDRIATLKVLKPTGQLDSTETLYPSFRADNTILDSLQFMNDTSYSYFYNTLSSSIDSTPLPAIQLDLYSDPLHPDSIAQTVFVWPAYYNQYTFDMNGVATDSSFVTPDSVIYVSYESVYTTFEVKEPYEIARSITPYGMAVDLWFDVTDYRTLLQDSVTLYSSVCGYSRGWQVTTDFYFIEGVPPMNATKVTNLWNGTFPYGNTANPIDSHLQPITLTTDLSTIYAKVRLITTGHGFGGYPNQNVAEFYDVHHSLDINSNTLDQHLWRSDCGSNPLSAQGAPGYTSTWFLERANWCPGSYVTPDDYNATPFMTLPAGSLTVDYNLAPYTVTGGPAGFYAPEYYIQSQVFEYDALNYTNNVSLEKIVAPTDAFEYRRLNPMCEGINPRVVIKNNGKIPLTSCVIHYGVDGQALSTYTWNGSLDLSDSTTVILPPVSFGSGNHVFTAFTDSPNGGNDEYTYDDTLHSNFNLVNIYNTPFIRVQVRTDDSPGELSWTVEDDQGNLIYSRSNYVGAGYIFYDTVYVSNGCYRFNAIDAGGDGLCCYNGTGTIRILKGGTASVMSSSSDFGDFFRYDFSIDLSLTDNEIGDEYFSVFPNPSTGIFHINSSVENAKSMIAISDLSGRVVGVKQIDFTRHQAEVDLSDLETGLYVLKIEIDGKTFNRKVMVTKD
jgi:hypothetical protein